MEKLTCSCKQYFAELKVVQWLKYLRLGSRQYCQTSNHTESRQYPGMSPDLLPSCRWARLMCCTAASSVGGRLFILGGSFFLLNIEHLRLARDVIPLPPYSFDKKERPSSIHASSLATGFTNSLRVTSEFRTKLIAFIFLPKGYETLSHPESAWAANRSKHFSPNLSAVVLISVTLFPHRHMCRRLLDPAEKKQQQYENVCVICVCMWVLPCWISSRRSLMITTSAFS